MGSGSILSGILGGLNTAVSSMVTGIGDAVTTNVGIVVPLAAGITGLFIVWRVAKRIAKA